MNINHNYLTTYFNEQYKLNEEWYNMQKELILEENESIISNAPEVLVDAIYEYLLGSRGYFRQLFTLIRAEWNTFYKVYRKETSQIKNILKKYPGLYSQEINVKGKFYGYNYDFKKSNSLEYKDLSVTDGSLILSPLIISSVKKAKNKKFKQSITMDNLNSIRGKMLDETSLTDSEFRVAINTFYRGSDEQVLIDLNDLKKLDFEQLNVIRELTRVKKVIDDFYNKVDEFLVIAEDTNYNNFLHDIKNKNFQDYLIIKTLEFKAFCHIYSTYFLSLLNNVYEKLCHDKDLLDRIIGGMENE